MAAVSADSQPLSGPGIADLPSIDVKGHTSHEKVSEVNEVSPTPVNSSDSTSASNGESKPVSYPKSRVDLVDRFLDEPRKLRVAVIGGGLSGIIGGCLLPAKVPGIELVIYEKNPNFVSCILTKLLLYSRMVFWRIICLPFLDTIKGGTWYENVYPGVLLCSRDSGLLKIQEANWDIRCSMRHSITCLSINILPKDRLER